MGAALAHEWEPPLQGRYLASEVNDGTSLEEPDHLGCLPIVHGNEKLALHIVITINTL